MNNFMCPIPKETQNIDTNVDVKRKNEVTELSNLIIHIVRHIAYSHETNEKSYMSRRLDM